MRNFTFCIVMLLSLTACHKDSGTPNNNSPAGVSTGTPTKQSNISVVINDQPIQVTNISYNRSGGSFNFTAQNSLQKVDVNCFHFYEQSWASFMYSDSIIYSTRPDSVTAWYSRTAINGGDVYFDCCTAPLQDPDITGNYYGNFKLGKDSLVIKGDFDLLFK